jgi:RING-H2 zinc finger domain
MQSNAPLSENNTSACTICMMSLQELNPNIPDETTIKILSICKHVFHRECIDYWFKTQEEEFLDGTCPLCRSIEKPLSKDLTAEKDNIDVAINSIRFNIIPPGGDNQPGGLFVISFVNFFGDIIESDGEDNETLPLLQNDHLAEYSE